MIIRWHFVPFSQLRHSTNFASTLEKRACQNEREERKKKKETLPPSPYRAPWAGVSKCSAVFMFLRTLDDLIYRWDNEVTLKTSRHRDVPAKRRSHNHPPKLFVVLGTKLKLPYGLPQFTAMKSGCFPRSFS